jgi:phosphohistidine phosphatase
MRVILFRHGPAGTQDPGRWPDDRERPLSERGETKTRAACRGLVRMERELSHILTSPLKRAAQTAKLLQEAAGVKPEILDALAPGGSARAVLARLGELGVGGVVALVGHEPGLGRLAGSLAFGPDVDVPLRKAGACAMDFDGVPQRGAGELRWLLPPKVLRRLGGKRRRAGA